MKKAFRAIGWGTFFGVSGLAYWQFLKFRKDLDKLIGQTHPPRRKL